MLDEIEAFHQIEAFKFVSHWASGEWISRELDSRKDLHSTKLKLKPPILVKLCFREKCGSELSGLHPFDNMVISWVKNRSKIERQAVSLCDTNP